MEAYRHYGFWHETTSTTQTQGVSTIDFTDPLGSIRQRTRKCRNNLSNGKLGKESHMREETHDNTRPNEQSLLVHGCRLGYESQSYLESGQCPQTSAVLCRQFIKITHPLVESLKCCACIPVNPEEAPRRNATALLPYLIDSVSAQLPFRYPRQASTHPNPARHKRAHACGTFSVAATSAIHLQKSVDRLESVPPQDPFLRSIDFFPLGPIEMY